MGKLPDQIRIVGDGIVIRELTRDDLPALLEIVDDPATYEFFALAETVDMEVLEAFHERTLAARAKGEKVDLAVTLDGNQLIGQAFIGLQNGVLGFGLGAAYRGQGLAMRAGRLVIDYAHDVLGLPTLIGEIDPTNHAMAAVVEKLGFRRVGPDTYEERGKTVTVIRWEHTKA